MDVSKFTEKFNKIEGNSYIHEEEVLISNNVYNGQIEHDNINPKTLTVYTGPKLTGDKITNYFLNTPSLAPWRYNIRIYAEGVEKVYISYETTGDQVEADDINLIQDELIRTQETLNVEENRAINKETEIEDNLNNYKEEVAEELSNRYTKEEVLREIEDLIGSAPETLDTLKELADALGNDPNFATTIINLLGNKVDKEEGKVLTTNDYTNEEKQKVESAYNLRIPYILVEGENNVFTATVEGITEYTDGLPLCIKLPVDSTDICTLDINDLGAITIQDSKELKANIPYNIRYEVTSNSFILQTKGGGGIDTSDATALEEDILINKSAYGPNGKLEGSMVNNVAVDIVLDTNNKEYTVPKGFHNGLGKIKAVITNLIASVIKYGSVVGGITGTFTGDATATAAQMLSGVIAYVKGNKIVGTMANRGAPTNGLNCGGVYNIADGYYSGGSITANSLASQTPANATAAQILAGYTAWVNGNLINGNSPNFQQNVGSFTIAPKQTGSINLGFIPDILILKISTTAALYDLYIYCNLFSITSKKSGGSYTTVDSSISDYISGTILSKYNSSINSTITCEYKAYKM